MYPTVFISEAFLDHFDETAKSINNQPLLLINESIERNEAKRSFERMCILFKNATIRTDIRNNKIVKYIKSGSKNYSTYKEWIIHLAVKDSRFFSEQDLDKLDGANSSYFTTLPSFDSEQLSCKTGILINGQPCTNRPFFLEHSFASIETAAELREIDICKHPCSSMIIIDKYLFDEKDNTKIKNLISLLKRFISSDLDKPFQLDIIIKSPENNSLLSNKFKQIIDEFEPNKLSLHLYAPMKLNESDRYFITNYSVITIGHPLDRNSNISCNFYLSHDNEAQIKSGFKFWKTKIEFVQNIIKETPKKIGQMDCIIKNDEIRHNIYNI